MGNQYPVVLLGCTGETTCPKSHKRSRSHMGFWTPTFWCLLLCMHHQLLFSSCLISLQIVFPAFNLSRLPMIALCCLQHVPAGDMSPWRTFFQRAGGTHHYVWRSWSLLKISCYEGWLVGVFCPAKSTKMRIGTTRFQKKVWCILQVRVTFQLRDSSHLA